MPARRETRGVRYQTVSYLERGKFSPSLYLALRIAEYFEVAGSDLLHHAVPTDREHQAFRVTTRKVRHRRSAPTRPPSAFWRQNAGTGDRITAFCLQNAGTVRGTGAGAAQAAQALVSTVAGGGS